MADVLLSPAASDPTSLQSPAAASAAAVERSKKHHRLNWLSWMRKSLTLGNKANQHRASGKLCACGFYHNYEEETKGLTTRSVFTTQMSSHHHQAVSSSGSSSGSSSRSSSSSSSRRRGHQRGNDSGPCNGGLSSSSPPNSPISSSGAMEVCSDSNRGRGLLPLRPIHLASRCHEEVLYTRLNRSCSINSAASFNTAPVVSASSTEASEKVATGKIDEAAAAASNAAVVMTPSADELEEDVATTSITDFHSDDLDLEEDQVDLHDPQAVHEQENELDEQESRIMVNLDAIEVVSNLDEARLLGSDNGSSLLHASEVEAGSTASTASSASSSSKCLSKFSSPFRRKPKGPRKSKEETFEKFLLSSEDDVLVRTAGGGLGLGGATNVAVGGTSGSSSTAISRDELLKLFILKLDEEANYFQVTASPEEELCDCQKCQIYYCEYYEKYLQEYERRRNMTRGDEDSTQVTAGGGGSTSTTSNLEASILMDDIMNNGMTFCSIM